MKVFGIVPAALWVTMSLLLVEAAAANGHRRLESIVESSAQTEATDLEIFEAVQLLVDLGVPRKNLCTLNSNLLDGVAADVLPQCAIAQDQGSSSTSWIRSRRERYLEETEEDLENRDDWFYITHATCALACVATAALAAGLTMGLLSLDPLLLLIKMRAGSGPEQAQAAALLPIVKQHHLLLVTLLLLNSIANEALPLFLEVLVSPLVAVLLSVTLVLFFGEIIPSAIFTGPKKVEIAFKLVPVVKSVMCLFYPIAYPIAKILDKVLHDEDGDEGGSAFDRGELSALVRIQYEERMAHKNRKKQEKMAMALIEGPTLGALDFSSRQTIKAAKKQVGRNQGSFISEAHEDEMEDEVLHPETNRKASIHVDEVSMVEGALSMKTKVALDVYTPLHRMFSIPYDTVLNERNVVSIYSSGFSRIPVYQTDPEKPKSKASLCGILMTKQLIVVNTNEERPLSTLPLVRPFCVSPKINLVNLLNLFQTGKLGHMALVCARPQVGQALLKEGKCLTKDAGLMGIITLEDVLESLLQEQIYDESDKLEREALQRVQWAAAKWKAHVRKRRAQRESGELPPRDHPSFGDVVQEAMANERSHLLGGSDEEMNVGGTNPGNLPYTDGGFDPVGGILGFVGNVLSPKKD